MTSKRATSKNPPITEPLTLAIVGHTNTGKTSLIRTLLRDSKFGEIADAAGTTRHVEAASIMMQNQAVIELRDTPGMEDSIALYTLLQRFVAQEFKGRQCLQHLIDERDDYPDFEQEIKVIKQALQCDVQLYIIDCRDNVFEKYRQEIQILSMASRPILPVLNFVNSTHSQTAAWRQALAELHLHATVEFDTVAFDFTAELRLYQKLQTLVESAYQQIQNLIDYRAEDWSNLRHACITQASRLMLNTAQHSLFMDKAHTEQSHKQLRDFVREREHTCLTCILNLLQFVDQQVERPNLPITDGQWSLDLFAPETLKSFGLDTASAAATGAAIGVSVDLLLAGLSLGAASAAGAAIGAAWSTSRRYGSDILARFNGKARICINDATIELLMLRQLALLKTLFHRGHAAPEQIRIEQFKSLPSDWPIQKKRLKALQQNPESTDSPRYKNLEQGLSCWINESI